MLDPPFEVKVSRVYGHLHGNFGMIGSVCMMSADVPNSCTKVVLSWY